jgi:Fe-S-cluster containining protein
MIFVCQRCGSCCHGHTTVSLNEEDRQRMVGALALPEPVVRQKFWRITGATVQMKTTDGHCIFYDQGCQVHGGRPWRCGQWPLHPSILTDENNYRTIAESCPGINKNLSYRQFCDILRELLRDSRFAC